MNLSWLDIERLTHQVYRQIITDGFKPDYIVGIASGGLVPLYALAKLLGIANILTITTRSYVHRGHVTVEILHSPCIDVRGKSVLIVDEIADSGATLTEVCMHIRETWHAGDIRSAVLCINTRNCRHAPTYAGQRVNEWVEFPWEIYEHQDVQRDQRTITEYSPRIYIASDCGFSGEKRPFYYDTLVPMVRSVGFTVLDPWEMAPKDLLAKALRVPVGQRRMRVWQKFNQVTGTTNVEAITSAHVLLAILNGSDVDSGVASEIGYAAAHGIPIMGYRDDIRLSGDNPGCVINLQVEHFIHKSGGRIYTTMHDVRSALEEFKVAWAY